MAKVLLVEDDPEYGVVVRDWLVHDKHTVELVTTGTAAIEFIELVPFELIILDWKLPDTSGADICAHYRRSGGKTPVLMLTGKSDIDDKLFGLDCGADDYLTKPVDLRELSARIRALLRRAPSYVDSVLTIGDVEVNQTTREVRKEGRLVHLLPKEYAVLEFMLRNRNRVFTADELIDRVWDCDSDVTSHSVRSCISRLRQKIDSTGKDSIIRTIYNGGYILGSDA